MNYKLITNKAELKGSCYFEFLPGTYQGKSWNDGSMFLTEESIAVFEYLLKEVNPDYDHYAFNEFSPEQISDLITKLEELSNYITNDPAYTISGTVFSEKYYQKINSEIRQNKDSIRRMLVDLIDWIKAAKAKSEVLSVLGM